MCIRDRYYHHKDKDTHGTILYFLITGEDPCESYGGVKIVPLSVFVNGSCSESEKLIPADIRQTRVEGVSFKIPVDKNDSRKGNITVEYTVESNLDSTEVIFEYLPYTVEIFESSFIFGKDENMNISVKETARFDRVY